MDLPGLIENYGYAAILVGTFLEGETILVLAGIAAHQGYLVLVWVILAAFLGSLGGDQLFFYLGRKHSRAVFSRRPHWKVKAKKIHRMMNRFETPMILSFRFLYGLRTVSPFVIGTSPVSFKKFFFLNAAGALIWAAVFASGGDLFGHALETIIGKVKSYEVYIMGSVAIVGLSVWIFHFFRRRRQAAQFSDERQ